MSVLSLVLQYKSNEEMILDIFKKCDDFLLPDQIKEILGLNSYPLIALDQEYPVPMATNARKLAFQKFTWLSRAHKILESVEALL